MFHKRVWGHNVRELYALILEGLDKTTGPEIDINALTFKPCLISEDSARDKARKIKAALSANKGCVRKTARDLHRSPNTIYTWMEELDIPRGYGRVTKTPEE